MNNAPKINLPRYFLFGLAWLILGAGATMIPLTLAGVAIAHGVSKALAVLILFGVSAIFCEHQIGKLIKRITITNMNNTLGQFVAYAFAFLLLSGYTARNLCDLALGPTSPITQLITWLFGLFVTCNLVGIFEKMLGKVKS
jgi:hypothetical protein